MVLAPTRELAIQSEENFRDYGKYLDLRLALLYGGVRYGKQNQDLNAGPDIVVATPGRLLDHLGQRNLRLDKVEILILDEVDRMLDMGFIEDVTKIIQKTPRSRQTLLFSATIPDAVVRLADWALENPVEAKINIKISAADTVKHALYPVPAIQKFDLLIALLEKIQFESVIIFFQTRRGTDRISRWLEEHGQNVRALHSDLRQTERTRALNEFKAGKVKILTATDLASRGLDISKVSHVINYDVPQHSEDYVHRIGRTGRAKTEGEAFTLLDETEAKLQSNTLVIADDNKALAMAGIFGGLHSGVTTETQDILLESAFFSRDAIMGRARQYGLHTDASHRYERGVDPQLQRKAMERATALVLEICGGEAGPVVEAVAEDKLPKQATVTLRRERLSRVLGISIDDAKVTEMLNRLGFEVTQTEAGWEAVAPSYRFDISIEEDLIEEIARVYGYNNIPNVAPKATLAMLPSQEAKLPLNTMKSLLLSRGYNEAITYSFVDPKIQNALFPDVKGMVLPHPISSDMSVMRVSLWPGLLGATAYNQKRQQQRVRMFETGLRFIPQQDAPNGVLQQQVIGGVVAGRRNEEHWDLGDSPVDFFDAKADVEALLALTGRTGEFQFVTGQHSALHPGMTAKILLNDEEVGYIGAIHPQFTKLLGVNGRVFVFELVVDAITERKLPSAVPVSRFPSNRRDIAITVKDEVRVGNVLSYIENIGVNQLVALNLFDEYKGKGIEPGYKSLALSLHLQDPDKTLEEAEIQQAVDTVVKGLESEFGAALRE